MTFVTKVHLSVDTIFKFFLFFHKVTFSLCDSDRSDKRSQIQNRQGLQLRWSRSFGQPPGWNKLRPVPGFWF